MSMRKQFVTSVTCLLEQDERACLPMGAKLLPAETYYRGGVADEITETLRLRPVLLCPLGITQRFPRGYRSRSEHGHTNGLAPAALSADLRRPHNV